MSYRKERGFNKVNQTLVSEGIDTWSFPVQILLITDTVDHERVTVIKSSR